MSLFIWRCTPILVICLGLLACGEGIPVSRPSITRLELLQSVPNESSKKGIELYSSKEQSSRWQMIREWPTGKIRIFRWNGNASSEIEFSSAERVSVLKIIESDGVLYFFTYDSENNSPSGRALNVKEGVDLWQVRNNSAKALLVADGLPLGGLDNVIYAQAKAGFVDACTIDRCLRINEDGELSSWNASNLIGSEIVELNFANEDAYAIVRRLPDYITGNPDFSRLAFSVAILRNPQSRHAPEVQPIAIGCLPFRLRWTGEKPEHSCATSSRELAEVLIADFKRLPINGLGEIGQNNVEGRIAWSLTYTLGALIYLDSKFTPNLSAAHDWSSLRSVLPEALALVARQGETSIGYASRRYSNDRSFLLFALHLGRIAELLAAGNAAGFGSDETKRAIDRLYLQLRLLEGTAETFSNQGMFKTLALRKGIAFWADGSNVPYNYISSYVYGLLASSPQPIGDVATASALLAPLIELEDLAKQPVWQYWWGIGRSGWREVDGISVNTPVYSGYSGFAHISYRSMDAAAVLRLARASSASVSADVMNNLIDQIAGGKLLPSVSRELILMGQKVEFKPQVAVWYGRSAAPWELQSQIFALEQLASGR